MKLLLIKHATERNAPTQSETPGSEQLHAPNPILDKELLSAFYQQLKRMDKLEAQFKAAEEKGRYVKED